MVGYSRLASANEDGALRLIGRFHSCVQNAVERHGGRVVKFVGDAALAEFSSTDAAARSAILLVEEFEGDSDTRLRVGLHVGDVVREDDGDLMGDGVNIAARLQAEAEPGEVLVSEDAWRQLRHREGYRFRESGYRHLKGQADPVRVFVILPDTVDAGEATAAASADPGGPGGGRRSLGGLLRRVRTRLPDAAGGTVTGRSARTSDHIVGVKQGLRSRQGLGIVLVPLVVVALFASVAKIWNSGLLSGRSSPPVAEAEASKVTTIAVMPFSFQGAAESDWRYLDGGLVTLLSSSLHVAGELHPVDPNVVLSQALGVEGSERVSLADAGEIAARLGADFFTMGTVVESAGKFWIDVSLYRPGVKPVALWREVVEGTDPWDLLDKLSRRILERQLISAGDGLSRLAVHTAPSLPALKAYLQGNHEFRAARYPDAVAALQVAVREDPSFALAHYRLSTAAAWSFEFGDAHHAAEKARLHSEHLPARYQDLISAWHAFLNGDWEKANRLYNLILAEDPQNVEAWSGLGEVQAHYNPLHGERADESFHAFTKVLQLAPNYGEARFHLMEFAAADSSVAAFESLLSGVHPKSRHLLSWQAARELSWGEGPRADSIIRTLGEAHHEIVGVAAARAAINFRDLDAAQSLAHQLTRPGRPDVWQAAGHIMIAQGHLARGDWASARAALDASAEVEPAWALEMRALGALLPDAPLEVEELRQLRAQLEVWNPGELNPEATFFFGTHADVHRRLRDYLLAMLSLRLDEDEAARQHSGNIQSTRRDHPAGSIGSSLRLSVDAHRAFRNGELELALQLLEKGSLQAPLERVALSPFFAQALDRYLRAEVLEALGRPDEALDWYASLSDGADLLFWAPAHRRQSDLLARMGRVEEAKRHAEQYRALRFTAVEEVRNLPLASSSEARAGGVR